MDKHNEIIRLLQLVRSESSQAVKFITTDESMYHNAAMNAHADLALDVLSLLTERKGSDAYLRASFLLKEMASQARDMRRTIEQRDAIEETNNEA